MKLIFTNKENETLFSKANIGDIATWDTSKKYEEKDFYDFLITHIKDKNRTIDILLIDCSLGKIITDYLGIRLGLLVRLISDLGDNRYVPIVFFSSENKDNIIATLQKNTRETLAPFFVTEGCNFVDFSLEEIKQKLGEMKEVVKIDNTIFTNNLSKISIKNLETSSSHHAFTNQWGVWKLAQATGNKETLLANTEFQKAYKTLYFQYLIAKDKGSEPSKIPTIDCKGKKILLIDDDAQKGWCDVLKKVFDNTIQCLTTKEDAETKIKDPNFVSETDIVLLDVRLTDEDRKNTTKAKDFSGYKLLEEIKKQNKGIQVIIFTASNKAWNMKHLVEAGADGYYIKESPDFQYEENYAQENFEKGFKEVMERAVEKADFLKDFCKNTKDLKKHVATEYVGLRDTNDPDYAIKFINSVQLSLDYAYDTISLYNPKQTDETQKYLNYAFVGYCNLIEFVLKNIYDGENIKQTRSFSQTTVIEIHSGIKKTYLSPIIVPVTLTNNKIASYQKAMSLIEFNKANFNGQSNGEILKDLLFKFSGLVLIRYNLANSISNDYNILKEKRNDFIHKNLQNLITLPDCKNIFRMVYIVLKGVEPS